MNTVTIWRFAAPDDVESALRALDRLHDRRQVLVDFCTVWGHAGAPRPALFLLTRESDVACLTAALTATGAELLTAAPSRDDEPLPVAGLGARLPLPARVAS